MHWKRRRTSSSCLPRLLQVLVERTKLVKYQKKGDDVGTVVASRSQEAFAQQRPAAPFAGRLVGFQQKRTRRVPDALLHGHDEVGA